MFKERTGKKPRGAMERRLTSLDQTTDERKSVQAATSQAREHARPREPVVPLVLTNRPDQVRGEKIPVTRTAHLQLQHHETPRSEVAGAASKRSAHVSQVRCRKLIENRVRHRSFPARVAAAACRV